MILVTLTLIVFMLQITHGKNEKLYTLASHNCIEDSLLHEFLGVALSLIVIMLQANFLLCKFLGLSPSLDKVVAVGCKEIFRVNNNLVLSSIPNPKYHYCKQAHMCNKENLNIN